MLSGRIARASAFRSATRRLPVFQTRSFIPSSISGPALAEEKFPDPPRLTEAEDPNQVSFVYHYKTRGPVTELADE